MEDIAIIDTYNLKRVKIAHLNMYATFNSTSKKSTLYEAIMKNNITVKDIMKWTWQIVDYIYDTYKDVSIYLHPINVYTVYVDNNLNIIGNTLFKRIDNSHTNNHLTTAHSMLNCNSSILKYAKLKVMNKRQQKELEIFEKLYNYTILYSNINELKDIITGAFCIIDRFCDLIEAGLVTELANI